MFNYFTIVFCIQLFVLIECKCGYDSCHPVDHGKLNIHLIPHSHDDVGWELTVDAYYEVFVNRIIPNVIKQLEVSPDRRFTQVETYFFHRWWRDQSNDTKHAVKQLVQNGQLVFSNGGWTVNDEGAAYYTDIIDQMTLGLRFLKNEFGDCGKPKVSWQIDPFGASQEMASLYAQMGFDGHVINRGVHPQGDFVWKASQDLNTRIFSTVLHRHYSAPDGYKFEFAVNAINETNIVSKVQNFVNISREWNREYGSTNHVLMTMGDDFQYVLADRWFQNMDILIREIGRNYSDTINIIYSSPQCYVKAMNELNRTFELRQQVDYLNYWVGYYTSRPALKYQTRLANNILQATKQLEVLADLDHRTAGVLLDECRNQQAVLTHHDAITGTSPQTTADDYSGRLQSAYAAGKALVTKAYSYLKSKSAAKAPVVLLNETFCQSLNISDCSFTETSDKIVVTIYNPIARPIDYYLRVPVVDAVYQVFDSNGVAVSPAPALMPVSDAIRQLPERKGSPGTHELVFKANLPALGFTTYFVEKSQNKHNINVNNNKVLGENKASIEMKGKSFTLQVDKSTGALKSVTMNGVSHKLLQTFKWYQSIGLNGQPGVEDSGSYNFCPNGTAHGFGTQKLVSRRTAGSTGLHELNQQFSDYILQTVRTYEDQDYIEFDWTVGPIPIGDHFGKEIVTRFETDLNTDGYFYTDANGRQTIKRKYNESSTLCNNNTIAGNYYPVYSRILIKDNKQDLQLTVLNDRTQGGSSLSNGTLELMVHRRVLYRGAGGSFDMNEPGIDGQGLQIRGKHYLFLKPISGDKYQSLVKQFAESLSMAPIVSFDTYSTSKDYMDKHVTSFTAVGQPLPESIRLLSLEKWSQNQVLIRLEDTREEDNNQLTQEIEVNLQKVFKTLKFKQNLLETNLVANELLNTTINQRLVWKSTDDYLNISGIQNQPNIGDNNYTIQLSPQQIRTFIATIDNDYHKDDKCIYNWIQVTQKTIPSNAYVAGHDVDNSTLNICRYKVNDNVIIAGKSNMQIGCALTVDGKEIIIKSDQTFEVLVANGLQWIPRHGLDPVPDRALPVVTNTMTDLKHTYIGRCDTGAGAFIVGKIDRFLYYDFKGSERNDCLNHEILVCA